MKTEFLINLPSYDGIGVYALINNQTGKMYIGSSQNIRQRILQHKSSPPPAMKEDIQQGNTFSVKILEKLAYGCNQFELFNRESYYIQKYDTLNKGYNRAKTTCCTKEELLTSLEHFKNSAEMSKYIKNIIAKRERPILPQTYNAKHNIQIDGTRFAILQEHAADMGESATAFINRAIDSQSKRDDASRRLGLNPVTGK